MSIVILASVALATGLATVFLGGRRRNMAFAIGVAGGVAVLGIALAMPPEESLAIGGGGIVATPLVRSLAVSWSASLLLLALLEFGIGARPAVVGPSLIGLAAAAIALAINDPATSMAALAAGGVAGVVIPGLIGWLDGPSSASRLPTTGRGALAILGSGLLALAVIAWGASAASPLGGGGIFGQDQGTLLGTGLALLVMVAAVAIRCGLIPLHVWAARFMEGVSPLAVPAAFSWGMAAFILIALPWSQVALGPSAIGDVERVLIIGLSVASLVLGGLAAMVHDDIEHVLGYSILQDAGIAVLAFASLAPDAVAASRDWLIASATVKTAFAAWAAVVRSTYGGHRLADLGGWARHSPALGIAFAGILVAAVGLPGLALFEARADLVSGSMPAFGSIVALLVALMPLIYLGRIALAGIAPVTAAIAAGPSGRPRFGAGRAAGWSEGSRMQAVRLLRAGGRANRAPLMALAVVVLAAIAVVTSIGGTGGVVGG
ncbi:MAG TPA: proton-conducting transporter membrane subunit [Candidatus Dormibacteraeota bacterium]|nr:proton-conducting transporter membrane subunit [Candidatus Dormibacteraeota bacterium]